VAIVDDIRRDKRTKNVLDQTNTKTVSAPAASTGLVGDQAPAEIFTLEDFNLVKNQVHLEGDNFQLLEALNTMGRITNMQSASGPLANTGAVDEITDTTGSGSPVSTLLAPKIGEAFEVTAFNWETKNANAVYYRIRSPTGTQGALVEYKTAAGTADITTTPVRVVYPQTLVAVYGTATGDNMSIIAYHQVR